MLTKKVIVSSISFLSIAVMLSSYITQTQIAAAANPSPSSANFEVNVRESLAVSITTPSQYATGDIDTFLRNKVNVSVDTNATSFVASMTTKTADTSLSHAQNKGTIPTLDNDYAKSSFPTNYWGYSINDTDAGNSSSTYKALVGVGSVSPISLISSAESSSISSRDIYFGAKADITKASGTYSNTIVISVVTGVIEEDPTDPGYNPTTPVDPATPANPEETPQYSGANTTTGGTTNGATTYTYTRSYGSGSAATTTTTTQISDGDNRNTYVGYTPPQGVTNRRTTTEEINEGDNSLATGLAVTSAAAATSGIVFFILAKRKKDDDEEEENQ